MEIIGIICEYNPFHNGHLYHLNKVKEMFPDSIIILVTNGCFSQRGNISIMNKIEKTNLCLDMGIDLIVELPFVFATQSSDIFASGAIQILNYLKTDYIVFGSESNNIEALKDIVKLQKTKKYNDLVKKYLDDGINYPTALSKAISELNKTQIKDPNDLLGLSYLKAIDDINSNIKPITIKRTNNYHDLSTNSNIISASAIRNLLKDNKKINKYVPQEVIDLNLEYIDINNFFDLLKYKIITEQQDIKKYQTVDEGIEKRILKYINDCHTCDELINKIKTKRYTYNKINRMLIHILCSFTKEEALKNKNIEYIRLLGFNNNGRKYLNKIKKEINIPIISKLSNHDFEQLLIENRVSNIFKLKYSKNINEYKEIPIYK